MSVYPRGEIWWVKFQVNGITVRQSAGTTKKTEAVKFERQLRAKLEDEARCIALGKPVKRTFGEALAKWLKSGAPVSMTSHARAVREHMESTPLLRSVSAANDMRAAMLASGLSPQTVNRRLAVVRRVLNLAYKQWEWIHEPLGPRIELMSEKGFEREVFLTAEQVVTIMSAMKRDEAQRFILLEAYTGMRKSEVRRLIPDNWRAPFILIKKSKGKRPRTIPLREELFWIMDSLPFTISEWHLRQDWDQARAAVGMDHVRMHDLRHTFASWLAADPHTPLTVIRDLLGHSNLATTSRYAHLKTQSLEDAILRLGGHKNGTLPDLTADTQTRK